MSRSAEDLERGRCRPTRRPRSGASPLRRVFSRPQTRRDTCAPSAHMDDRETAGSQQECRRSRSVSRRSPLPRSLRAPLPAQRPTSVIGRISSYGCRTGKTAGAFVGTLKPVRGPWTPIHSERRAPECLLGQRTTPNAASERAHRTCSRSQAASAYLRLLAVQKGSGVWWRCREPRPAANASHG